MGGERGLPPYGHSGEGSRTTVLSSITNRRPTAAHRGAQRTAPPQKRYSVFFSIYAPFTTTPPDRPLRLKCSTSPSPRRRDVTSQPYHQQLFSQFTSLLYRL